MLVELAVRDLGVVSALRVDLAAGMCAVTGETGAGKTLIIEAIGLLLGARSDAARVRPGADAAVVEGRFVDGDDETVLRRVVPAQGRSRCYVDGQLATLTELAERGGAFVEIHGQHAQQALLRPKAQRDALDRFGGVDTGPYLEARRQLRAIEDEIEALGGDDRARARELDLVRFQVAEIDGADLTDPDELAVLAEREDLLADATRSREVGAAAGELLGADDGATDLVARAAALIADHRAFAPVSERLVAVAAELGDCAAEVRSLTDGVSEDPEQLDEVRRRRQSLLELRRKYGDTIADVIAFGEEARGRLEELEGRDARAAALESELAAAVDRLDAEAAALAAARAAAAPGLAAAVEERLADVGLPSATFDVEVGGVDGSEVQFTLAANRGMEAASLTKVASGGELSRVMLAIHQVLSAGPPTMVFDEVDAGIGGVTAAAVGASLARLARERQVLVVTHLPQVAACADLQVSVRKDSDDRMTTSTVTVLDTEERVVELARMLSGSPDSEAAHEHARELLTASGRIDSGGRRGRGSG